MTLRLLFIGDVMEETGCAVVRELVPSLRREISLHAVVVSGENSAPTGRGINAGLRLRAALCSGFRGSGQSCVRRRDGWGFLDREPKIVRLANFDAKYPGQEWRVFEAGDVRIGVVNVLGRVFMDSTLRSPFASADRAVEELEAAGADLVLVNVHAEATSEKQAIGYHLAGRAQAVV